MTLIVQILCYEPCSCWCFQARLGKLSESGIKFVGSMSAWTATLLFMWMPVAQMVVLFWLFWKKHWCKSDYHLVANKFEMLIQSLVSVQWTNLLNPDNIKGLSATSMLLAMVGNGLMIPRALLTRDLMWYAYFTWAFVSIYFHDTRILNLHVRNCKCICLH